MKLFLSFIFFTSLLFADTINVSEGDVPYNNLEVINDQITPDSNKTAFNDTNRSEEIEKKQSIFLSYGKIPSSIIVNQQFAIKVKAIVATQNFDNIKDRVIPQKNFKVLNLDENWTKENDYRYYKTFYMRAKENNATFPQIFLELFKNDQLIASQQFPELKLNIISLHTDKYFSNIVADSLDIVKTKTTKFDENSLLVVLEIVAKDANLKDFKLSWVIRDGVDSFVDKFPMSKIYYYAIVPKYTKKFIFTYFNIKQNRLIKKSINLTIDNEEISTQSDLNPRNSSFTFFKNMTYGFLAIILLLIFFKRRRVIYLLLFVTLIVLFFSNINPLKNISIAKNSKVYILPIENSTIFYIAPKKIEVQKLSERENYIKIILPNKKIGWVKEQNVVKN